MIQWTYKKAAEIPAWVETMLLNVGTAHGAAQRGAGTRDDSEIGAVVFATCPAGTVTPRCQCHGTAAIAPGRGRARAKL